MPTSEAFPPPGYVDIAGTRLATYVLGPYDRESLGDVVLCHGTPWSSAVWEPVAHRLAATHRVFLWDMPGYGASISGRPSAVDLASQWRRLAELLRRWGLDRPHVVAHDIGGAVALGAHLLESTSLSSLYLLDVVTLDPWGSPFFRLVAEHQDVFASLPGNLHAALVREYVAGAAHRHLDADRIDDLVRPWTTGQGQRAFYQQIAELSPVCTRAIAERLHGVRCPVRIGWGEEDPWIPVTQSTRLAALLPGDVDVLTIPRTGHLAPLEATETLADDIGRWLDDVESIP